METQYLPKSHNYCVYAEYAHKKSNFYGWDLAVHNHAEEADGTVHDSTKDTKGAGLCAKLVNATAGKLEVAPCFLPPLLAGPYWVVHFEPGEGTMPTEFDWCEGWALIVGGQPTIPTAGGLCRTGTGVNNAGLWIFSRDRLRNDTQISQAHNIANAKGIDVSVLNDVDQTNCTSHN